MPVEVEGLGELQLVLFLFPVLEVSRCSQEQVAPIHLELGSSLLPSPAVEGDEESQLFLFPVQEVCRCSREQVSLGQDCLMRRDER